MDNIEIILGNTIALRVLKHLWITSKGATGRGVALAIGYSPQAVNETLKLLESTHLVQSIPVGNANWYDLNRKHWFLSEGLFPLWEKMDSWLLQLGLFYSENLETSPLSIILFGSYARGEAKEESDLDLLFIYKEVAQDFKEDILKLDSHIFEKFGVHPSCQIISLAKFKREIKNEGFMRNIYREGKSISGKQITELI